MMINDDVLQEFSGGDAWPKAARRADVDEC
jgi:hypothetical protein